MLDSNIRQQLAATPIHAVGYNPSGFPLMDDGDRFRDPRVDEDLTGECDSIEVIPPALLTRSIPFSHGWTEDMRLFLRAPAIRHLLEYDAMLQRICGWRLRIADAYRPWTVQQVGFQTVTRSVLRTAGKMTVEDFESRLKRAVTVGETPECVAELERILNEVNNLIVCVKTIPYDPQCFPAHLPEIVIRGAANFAFIDLPLYRYDGTPHSTGGVVDMEWVDIATGRLVNVGVPVDCESIVAAFPYFETRTATCLAPKLKALGLRTLVARQAYYLEQVRTTPSIRACLEACDVDVGFLLKSPGHFRLAWWEIRRNRRILIALAEAIGLKFYGLECWHADCNDARGGVRAARRGIVSGAGGYAIYAGQTECAWGNATRLWEELRQRA